MNFRLSKLIAIGSTVAVGATLISIVMSAPPAHAVTCAAGGSCALGDIGPGGGIVFIAPSTPGNSTGQFFEAAANTWNGSAPDGTGQWCNASNAGLIGLGDGIGSGTTNTTTIAAACASTGTGNASKYISGLTIGGRTGWFLPSRDEMLALYDQRALLTGSFATNQVNGDAARYLTSSQDGTVTNAIGVFMQGSAFPGDAQGVSKQFNFSLRPVRMFSAPPSTGIAEPENQTPPAIIQQVGMPPSGSCEDVVGTRFDSQTSIRGGWGQSWAQWMNGGLGGTVCTRMLAYSSSQGRWVLAD